MIQQEMSMIIRHFVREGVPVARVARQFGVCRQSVYNHVGREGGYRKPHKARTSKLDPYKEYVRRRLERFDLPATVLFKEVRVQGYEGGRSILSDFVCSIKREQVIRVTERFESEPGCQAQIDFAECGSINVDGVHRKLYLFDFVLGYSRMMHSRFIISTKQHELFSSLKAGFGALGVPGEILVDNMKQVVEHHDPVTGIVRFNRAFLDFAEHYGFVPVAAPPYWPRVKGKVERNIGYVKRSFLCGRSFEGLDDLNAQFTVWQDSEANVRIHGTTGRRPVELYAEELKTLRPAGAIPVYDARPCEIRVAGRDCHIRYCGVSYSVDPKAARRSVVVRPGGERVGDRFEVYLGSELVAAHYRRSKGTVRVTLPEHATAIRRLTRGRASHRRVRGVQFEQMCSTDSSLALVRDVPVVETRSLELYESLLGAKP
jgi:transposase